MVEKSLKDLCIDYLDLYLIHSSIGIEMENGAMKKNAEGKFVLRNETDQVGIWREMEKLVDEGKIRVVIQEPFYRALNLHKNCTFRSIQIK